jgi:hypothetical protein
VGSVLHPVWRFVFVARITFLMRVAFKIAVLLTDCKFTAWFDCDQVAASNAGVTIHDTAASNLPAGSRGCSQYQLGMARAIIHGG